MWRPCGGQVDARQQRQGCAAVAPTFFILHQHCNDGAPASRSAAFSEAITFVGGLLCVSTLSASRAECVACAAHCSARAATRQRRPLTVSMVMELEKAVAEDEGREELDALVAGAVLFVVYGQVRVGDLRRCIEEPELDLTEFVGFLETHFTEHKTARASTKRALPIACSADGLTSMLWGRLWLQARVARGFRGDLQQTVFPAMGRSGQWLATAFTTPEFSAAFRGGHSSKGLQQ